jgi:hypothetical protein
VLIAAFRCDAPARCAEAEWLQNATPKQRLRLLDEDPEMDLTPEMIGD